MGTGPMKIATLQNVPESLALLHSSFLPLPYCSRRCGTEGDLWAFHKKLGQVPHLGRNLPPEPTHGICQR